MNGYKLTDERIEDILRTVDPRTQRNRPDKRQPLPFDDGDEA